MGKKGVRTLYSVGKEDYDFDYKYEKNVYDYWCCNIKDKNVRKLHENHKFSTYKQWENYINKKYEDYTKDRLINFSKYINTHIRSIKPNREYWNLITPILLTLIIAQIPDVIIDLSELNMVGAGIIECVIVVLLIFIFIIIIFIPIKKILDYIWYNNEDESFLNDYKQIVDEMIRKKQLENKIIRKFKIIYKK